MFSLKQRAVLWAFSRRDRNGEPKVSAAVEIAARWEEDLSQSIQADGSPIAINATVDVDRDIAVGSIMWLGELADLPVGVSTGLFEVMGFNKIPDYRGKNFSRSVQIRKWRSSLPTIV